MSYLDVTRTLRFGLFRMAMRFAECRQFEDDNFIWRVGSTAGGRGLEHGHHLHGDVADFA